MASPSNPFDEFDKHLAGPRAVPVPENPFDEFDGASPIERGVAKQEAADALAQARAQQEYAERQRAIAKMDRDNPQWAPNPLVVDEPPAVKPFLEYTKEPLPPSPVQKIGAQMQMDLLENENRQRQIMARTLFPDIPVSKAMQRVGFYDGKPVYIDDKGEMQQLSSGMGRFLANMTANSPEMLGATVGSFAGPGGAAAGAAGMHGIKRGVASLIYNEPTTVGQNLTGMAIEGGLTLAGEAPARVVNAIGNKGTFLDMSRRDLQNAQAVQKRIKGETGIDVDLAQASDDPRLISLRAYLGRYPGKSAKTLADQDEKALEQFHKRTTDVLDAIATAKPAEIAEAGGVNAADAALRTARREVSNKVRPLYNRAYEKNPVVTDPDILGFMKLPFFPEAYRAGQQIARLEEKEAATIMAQTVKETRVPHSSGKFKVTQREVIDTPISQPDLRSLDYLKQGLDAQIAQLKDAKQFKLAGALEQQKKAFVEALDRLPSPEYKAAREAYAKLRASTIDPLEQGPVGVLAQLKDQSAVGAAAKIFGDSNVTDTQIARAKAAIQAENPQAWNDLVRTWLGNRLNEARTETQRGIELNTPGKFRQDVYGNEALRTKMKQILPAGAVDDFDNLMFAAQKLASTPVAGSNTFRDTQIGEMLKSRSMSVFKWLTQFRKKAIDTAERADMDRGSQELAAALVDPTKVKHIRRILQMKPSTQQALLLSTVVGARTGAEALRDEVQQSQPDSEIFAQ